MLGENLCLVMSMFSSFITITSLLVILVFSSSHLPLPDDAHQEILVRSKQCHFSDYLRHRHLTSWEFQVDVPPEKCIAKSRQDLLSSLSHLLVNLTYSREFDLDIFFGSLRTSIFDQYSVALTTLDGKPLFPSKCSPTILPFRGPAFIRHRRKHAMLYHNISTYVIQNETLMVQPGRGDITLKIKDVNLDAFQPFHSKLNFCKKVRQHGTLSCLKWKIENDRYCNVGRASYEALYHPVKLHHKVINTRDHVEAFFPGLWRYFGYRRRNVLPLFNQRAFAKSVWDMRVAGLRGVLNWVVSYPSLLDALSGSATAVGCELSMRLKREWAEKDEKLLELALNQAVNVFERMHKDGWDTGVH